MATLTNLSTGLLNRAPAPFVLPAVQKQAPVQPAQGAVQQPAQATAQTPAQTIRSAVIPPSANTFMVQVPDSFKSTALNSKTTVAEARNQRDAMEAQQTAQLTSRQMFEQGLAGIQSNPQSIDFLSGIMFPDATATTQQRDTLVTEQRGLMQQARDFITGRRTDSAGRLTDLQEEAGLPDLQERIATSNERVAQLRGELMKVRPQVETEAGQTRIGAEARLGPVERNLQAEIASEALVQAALVGNANMVQGNIDKILELEFQDQQMELSDMMLGIQMVGDEIKTLEPKLQEEANQRLAQFNFALQERASALQTAQANKAQTLNLMAQVAQNGAPDSVLQAMRNAQTPEQAMTIGGAYMSDSLDRQLKQAQIASANRANQITTSASEQLYSGLSTPTATAVRAKVAKFSSEPLVQNFATIQDGFITTKALSDTTDNPSDDQTLIYQFAKVMDPGSVVREGEYATVQKYSQSLVDSYGKSVTQALTGTGFLTEEARKNIKSAIESRYNASKKTYENMSEQYVDGINNLTGRKDGSDFIMDYAIPAENVSFEVTPHESIFDSVMGIKNGTSGTTSNVISGSSFISKLFGL